MIVLGNRILVSKVEEEKKEGFQTVEVQDSFLYKGKVEQIGSGATVLGTSCTEPSLNINSIVLFTKYCPHTQSITHEGVDYKIIRMEDVIAVL